VASLAEQAQADSGRLPVTPHDNCACVPILSRLAAARRRLAPPESLNAERGAAFAAGLAAPTAELPVADPTANRLECYFDAHTTGPGIWKWRHYFEIYHRHFARFVGTDVHVVEIGIFSGGSLGMWRDWFGDRAHIYGIDIDPACAAYEAPGISVFIGDQGDAGFWRDFVNSVRFVDVVIDDGSHAPEDQIATLEALLPHMRPGGVYLCEDVSGRRNRFQAYVCGLARELNGLAKANDTYDREATPLQRLVHSVHLYPLVTVIELRGTRLERMAAPRHGTEWQPGYEAAVR
jgi:hypothetical protein